MGQSDSDIKGSHANAPADGVAHRDLAGQTALVTGGARRLGRAIVEALAECGVNIVIHYHDSRQAAESLADRIRGRGDTGVQAWTIEADLSDPHAAESLISRALETAGRVDILVNNASVFKPDTVWDLREETLLHNVRLHAWAPLALARALARQGGPGRIVNLLDTRLTEPDPKHVAYQLSKQMLASLTRILAVELAPRIRINAVAPGLILPPKGRDEKYLQALAHTNPLGRHGDVRDVAQAVLYLLQAPFVTGQVIHVDGGRHLGRLPHDTR